MEEFDGELRIGDDNDPPGMKRHFKGGFAGSDLEIVFKAYQGRIELHKINQIPSAKAQKSKPARQ
ncbi:MAG: hypothetical protein JRF60_16640 [Deltaproteobacteria bacterium]|nr:hypothetical protein [Deltaproteobacteria bacterium]